MIEELEQVREGLRQSLGYFNLFNEEEDETKWPRYVSSCEKALQSLDKLIAEYKEPEEWEFGIIYFHPDKNLRHDLEHVFRDCQSFITDILLNDIQQTMRKWGYNMKIYKKAPDFNTGIIDTYNTRFSDGIMLGNPLAFLDKPEVLEEIAKTLHKEQLLDGGYKNPDWQDDYVEGRECCLLMAQAAISTIKRLAESGEA